MKVRARIRRRSRIFWDFRDSGGLAGSLWGLGFWGHRGIRGHFRQIRGSCLGTLRDDEMNDMIFKFLGSFGLCELIAGACSSFRVKRADRRCCRIGWSVFIVAYGVCCGKALNDVEFRAFRVSPQGR